MIDALDRAIISFLQFDGRMSFTKIAAELDVSEATVRRRVNKLTEDGILQIVAVVEPHQLGWHEAAMIGISAISSQITEVGEAVAKLPEVSY